MVNNYEIIYSLCVKNDWFTEGTDTQYEKMLRLAKAGYPVDIVARCIWLCSDDEEHSYNEIFSAITASEYTAIL